MKEEIFVKFLGNDYFRQHDISLGVNDCRITIRVDSEECANNLSESIMSLFHRYKYDKKGRKYYIENHKKHYVKEGEEK